MVYHNSCQIQTAAVFFLNWLYIAVKNLILPAAIRSIVNKKLCKVKRKLLLG